MFGVIALIAILLYGITRLFFGPNWKWQTAKAMVVGMGLTNAIKQTLEELPKPSKQTVANLGAHIIYRFTRIAFVGLLLALVPIILLMQQNQLFGDQN